MDKIQGACKPTVAAAYRAINSGFVRGQGLDDLDEKIRQQSFKKAPL